MKLAFFHTAFQGLGGAELLAAAQATYLREQGHDVSMVTFGFREEDWRERLAGIPVSLVPRRHWTDLFTFGNRLWKWRRRGRRAETFLRNVDLVLAHNPPTPAMLGHAGLPARRAWYCHEAPWRLHPEATDYFLIHRLPQLEKSISAERFKVFMDLRSEVLARARRDRALAEWDLAGVACLDRILANSAFCARNLQLMYGMKDVTVVPPIVAFGEHTHRPGLDRQDFQVMTLARLGDLKNVETVVRGFACFAGRLRTRARLHVVGDGRERAALQDLAQELGIGDRVIFHGYLDPVRDQAALDAVYQACDVFALLPIDESFGLVYPEAAARGLLLVGPDHGGPVEILENGRLGWTVPVLSPEALSAALEEAWSLSDADVDRRRREADRSCRARFSVEVVGPMLKNELEKTSS